MQCRQYCDTRRDYFIHIELIIRTPYWGSIKESLQLMSRDSAFIAGAGALLLQVLYARKLLAN